MLRVPLNKAYLKRTIRPTYAFTQATPVASILDSAWNRAIPIWPGMVAMKTKGHNVTLYGGAAAGTNAPFGLFGEYIGGDGIDEPLTAGVNVTAVWVLGGPDAEFEVLAPAFDASAFSAATDPGDGTSVLLTTYFGLADPKRGQLCPIGATGASTKPIARLISVDSASKITIGGLQGTA